MYNPAGVKTSAEFPVPGQMKAWVLGGPDQLSLREKPTPVPRRAEVLVRIDAVAICATDLEIIHGGSPASIEGGLPFNKNFTPGHEYMGTVAALGPDVDEFSDRRARHRGNPCRLRPVQAMPPGHVYVVPELREAREGSPRQRLYHRRRVRRIRRQPHQHAGAGARYHERRRGNAGGHGRHLDVRPDRTRRAGCRRKRGRDRPGADRIARGRRRQRRWAQAR